MPVPPASGIETGGGGAAGRGGGADESGWKWLAVWESSMASGAEHGTLEQCV